MSSNGKVVWRSEREGSLCSLMVSQIRSLSAPPLVETELV